MSFVIRMALREVRASWQRLLFFFVCIAVGVASIVAIRSVIQSVRAGLTAQAQEMTGGDIALRSNNAFTPRTLDMIERERSAGRIATVSNGVEIATMVRPDVTRPLTKMVELRAVDESYPLYGTLTLREGTYSYATLRGRGAIVRPELLAQLGLRVGDRIFIGSQSFEIRGVIASEPGRNLGAFTLGPRVIVDRADLADTGLLSFGTRALHLMLLRVPQQATLSV
jgi:putative ABC transport system permease protein